MKEINNTKVTRKAIHSYKFRTGDGVSGARIFGSSELLSLST
jgi:hypothetical protein